MLFRSLCIAALLVGAPALAQSPEKPKAEVPWTRIEAGLTQLAAGDGKAAEESFRAAGKADASGLSGVLDELTEAYVAIHGPVVAGALAPWVRAEQRLNAAAQRFHRQPVPQAVVGEALTRIRKILKPAPSSQSPDLLRPLLCNLRLLAGDHATDGEPVLEVTNSKEVGSLTRPQGVFTPQPVFTAEARKGRTKGTLVIRVKIDSEGCPTPTKVLKPELPDELSDQALSILRWYAYEPATYQGSPVAIFFNLSLGFTVA
jgi:hypothetical protein